MRRDIDKNIQVDEVVKSENGNDYEIIDFLGSGGNGVVFSCADIMGNEYAIKFLIKTSNERIVRFHQEVELMKKAVHPHLIKYVDNGITEGVYKHTKQIIEFVVMEKADKNLLNYLKENREIEYAEYIPQFRGLCEALSVLHKYAIHRDIKPENILIKGSKWILSDLGLCKFVLSDYKNDITAINEKIGPIFWMSPEAIDAYYWGENNIGTYSDVFQLCSVFAFVLTHKYPGGVINDGYDVKTTPEIKKLIIDSLSNNYLLRPQNGDELLKRLNDALPIINP